MASNPGRDTWGAGRGLAKAGEGRFVVLRLEDAVALLFFLLTLALRIIFRHLDRQNVSPADVLIIIPAATLLLAKEMVNYFLGAGSRAAGSGAAVHDRHGGSQEVAEARQRAPLGDFVRPYWNIVRDWFPFLVILMMYYSLWGDATLLIVTHDRDAALIVLDQRLFGFQASVALERIVSPGLTRWMEFAYFYHVLHIPVVACFLYIKCGRRRFREMMGGLMVITFFGLMGYLLVPAVGPMYTLRHLYTVPLRQPLGVFERQMDFMNYARIRRDAFPSLHVGMSFLVWLYARRNSKRLFWILSPLVLSLWFATLYLRYHYLIDVVAGLALAPLCYLLANWLFARRGEIPIRASLPRRWVEGTRWR